MASVLVIVSSLFLIWASTLAYRLVVNLFDARKAKLPYVVIPWDQNGVIWMIISVPLRPWLKRNLPKWIFDRLSLTIYGFEFHERLRPFEQFSAPQGDDKSFIIVTTGKFELSTRDPEIIQEMFNRPSDFIPVDLTELFLGKFGPNVLTSVDASWARQRKIVASVINERISKAVFNESIHQAAGLVDEVVGTGAAGDTNRMFDMMKKITINVLSGAGMGTSVEWKDNANEKPQPGFKTTYIEAVKRVIDNVAGPIILPQWFLSNYPSFLPGYQNLKALSYAVTEFPIHTRKLLDQERARTEAAHGATRSNIMSQILHASELQEATDEKANGSGKGLSPEEMLGNLFVFTAGGFDTTANTLAYALVLLCRYPQWQAWLHAEIDEIMPSSTSTDTEDELDYATIFPRALRIQACMYEVLRLYPPVIHVSKMTRTPQRIVTSRNTYQLPARTTVYVHTIGLHHEPGVWRNLNLAPGESPSATDEELFRPTRWLQSSSPSNSTSSSSPTPSTSNSTNTTPPTLFRPPKGTYVPFSGGPRVCPGQKMALVEFTAIFLRLFHAHRIEAVPSSPEETRAQREQRLDALMGNSAPILTLQMNEVYDVKERSGRGLRVRLSARK